MPKTTRIPPQTSPSIEHYPILRDWLDAMEARFMIRLATPTASSGKSLAMEAWHISGTVFWVQLYSHRGGWDIFTSAGTNNVAETLFDAVERLNVFGSEERPVPRNVFGSEE